MKVPSSFSEDPLLPLSASGMRMCLTTGQTGGGGALWVIEFDLTNDGVPLYAVSIMEFRDGLLTHDAQPASHPPVLLQKLYNVSLEPLLLTMRK